jgi:amphi-Trp domain-containing protein
MTARCGRCRIVATGGLRFKVHVPDEVDFKLEIEIEDNEKELEIELKW